MGPTSSATDPGLIPLHQFFCEISAQFLRLACCAPERRRTCAGALAAFRRPVSAGRFGRCGLSGFPWSHGNCRGVCSIWAVRFEFGSSLFCKYRELRMNSPEGRAASFFQSREISQMYREDGVSSKAGYQCPHDDLHDRPSGPLRRRRPPPY